MGKVMTSFKKRVALLTILCMIFTLMPMNVSAATDVDSDISGHWAEDTIQGWMDEGTIEGYEDGSFKPENNISRAEFMTLVNGIFNYTEMSSNTYTDVKADAWYANAIAKAVKAGVIDGYPDGTMRPESSISREEAATIMMKISKLMVNEDAAKKFIDAGSLSWSKGAVGAVCDVNIMNGYPDLSFQAKNNIKRGEAVVALDNAVLYGKNNITYDTAGTYGPVTGTFLVTGNAIILEKGITLQNMVISGDLIIDKNVGEGDVTLKNVTVKGETKIYGGGANSIIVIDSTLGNVTVSKVDGKIRILISGHTTVGEVTANSGVTLQESNLAGDHSGFQEIILDAEDGDTIIMIGSFTNVEINSHGLEIQMPKGTTIDTLTLNEMTDITGVGIVGNADINVSGVTFETEPKTMDVATGVTEPVIETPAPAIGGGGGGSSSNDMSVTVSTSTELETALETAKAGETIFVRGTLGSTAAYTIYDVTKAITIKGVNTGTEKAKVYGTFNVKENATITNLEILNKGGIHPHKNAINIVGRAATVTNNIFTMNAGAEIANGLVVWATGAGDATLTVTGNKFVGYVMDTGECASAAFLVVEGISVNSAIDPSGPATSDITIANEEAMALANEYITCNALYEHKDWSAADGGVEFLLNESAGRLANVLATPSVHTMKAGGTILLRGTLGNTTAYTVYDVAKAITIKGVNTGESKAKVYGTFNVKENATITNLEILNQGGTHPNRNAINVVGRAATITNNIFTMDSTAGIANGLVVWATDTGAASLTVTGNKFVGYVKDIEGWASAAFLVVEGIPVNEAIDPSAPATSDIVIANEEAMALANDYVGCNVLYEHKDWSAETGGVEFLLNESAGRLAEVLATPATVHTMKAGGTILLRGEITVVDLIIPTNLTIKVLSGANLIITGTLTGTLTGEGNWTGMGI